MEQGNTHGSKRRRTKFEDWRGEMNEVLGQAVAVVVENLRRLDVPIEAAVAKLGVGVGKLREPACRVDWSAFVDFAESAEDACGGPEAMQAAFARIQPRIYSDHLPVFRRLLSSRDIYRLVNTAIRLAYSHLQVTETDNRDGCLVVTIDIPEPHRPCAQFWNACLGSLRSVPEIAGRPHVEVAASLSPRRGVFSIVLNESRTVTARLSRASVSVLLKGAVAEVERSWTETRSRIAEVEAQNARLVDVMHRLEQEVQSRRRTELALRAALDVFSSSAYLVSAGGTVSALDETASTALAGEGAELAARMVLAAQGQSRDPTLLAREVGPGGAGGHIVIRTDAGRAFAARLDRVGQAWQLTERHIEVAALVVRGLGNKEIAARLSCAVHTIELHVTELLRRSQSASRSGLIASFWSTGNG